VNQFEEVILNDGSSDSWLFNKYYQSGFNCRYWTFQMALNLLVQRTKSPVIIETGCQRLPNDFGAGMSTSIFGEFCFRYNGKLYTVDSIKENLEICKECTKEFSNNIEYLHSDSVVWLRRKMPIIADLIYLDSFDHPYGQILDFYGGKEDLESAIQKANAVPYNNILKQYGHLIEPCQRHCLNEFIEGYKSKKINDNTIVLIDDNQLPGGGKTRLVKKHLIKNNWICLFDHQQTLWVKNI
jgi:hypothetical protein